MKRKKVELEVRIFDGMDKDLMIPQLTSLVTEFQKIADNLDGIDVCKKAATILLEVGELTEVVKKVQ